MNSFAFGLPSQTLSRLCSPNLEKFDGRLTGTATYAVKGKELMTNLVVPPWLVVEFVTSISCTDLVNDLSELEDLSVIMGLPSQGQGPQVGPFNIKAKNL